MQIEQAREQFPFALNRRQRIEVDLRQPLFQQGMVFRRQRLTLRQTLRHPRQLAIMRRLVVIDVEIVKTRRIEQSQSLKMCFLPVAIGCRAQENDMFCLGCQLLDQRKLGALWLQVMRLVDDDYIPRTLHEGFTDLGAERTDKELGVEQLLG